MSHLFSADPLGHVATSTYSPTGHLANQTDPGTSGGGTTAFDYTYDDLDRRTSVGDALGHRTTECAFRLHAPRSGTRVPRALIVRPPGLAAAAPPSE